MRYPKIGSSVFVLAILLGCSATQHFVLDIGSEKFTDVKSVEDSRQAHFYSLQAAIKPRSVPLAKFARFVIPTRDVSIERSGTLGNGAREALGVYNYRTNHMIGELIRHRNIFERVEIEEAADGGHVPLKPGEVVIYFYLPDNLTRGWYYISESTKRTPLYFDTGNPEEAGRIKFFIDSVEALASGEPR